MRMRAEPARATLFPATSHLSAFAVNQSPTMKITTIIAILTCLTAHTALADVRINEIMASNGSTIADEDGDFEDWIELINTGSETADLSEWGLSDSQDNPFKWVFPEGVELGPSALILLMASGKNRTDPELPLHTNFSISAAGEAVHLTKPGGMPADHVPAILLPRDVSYGRQPDGSGDWFYFASATPGTPNTEVPYAGILDEPAFSHTPGYHDQPFLLEISHPDPLASLYYTLDGSEPDPSNLDGRTYSYKNSYPRAPGDPFGPFLENSFHTWTYAGPIAVTDRSPEVDKLARISSTYDLHPPYFPTNPVRKGTVVRAVAVRTGMLSLPGRAHSYFVGENPYELPIISMTVQEDDLFDYHNGIYVAGSFFDDWRISNPNATASGPIGNFQYRGAKWERQAHIEIFFSESPSESIRQNIGVRIHGNWSRRNRAKNLRIYARRGYDTKGDLAGPFFEDPVAHTTRPDNDRFARLLLRRMGAQGSPLNDVVANRLMVPVYEGATRSRPSVMFLNGEYWGLTFLRDRFDQHHLANHYDLDPDDIVITYSPGFLPRASYNQSIDVGDLADMTLFRIMEDAILKNDLTDQANYTQVKNLLDVRSYIDKIIMVAFLCNNHYEHGYWRVREPVNEGFGDGRWRTYVKDFDSIRSRYGGAPSGPEGFEYVRVMSESIPIFKALLASGEFRDDFINRFCDHLNTTFLPERFIGIVEKTHLSMAPYLAEDFQRWRESLSTFAARDSLENFANQRPVVQRDNLRQHFGLGSDALLSLDVLNPAGGIIQLNTIQLSDKTPGIAAPVHPWTGTYFQDVPITLRAIPEPGYRFAGWVELPGEESAEIEVTLDGDATFTAMFEEVPVPLAIHSRDFEDEAGFMEPSHSLVPDAGITAVITAGSDAEVVRHPNAAQGFGSAHLRVNEPLDATLTFALPTTGFEGITLDFLTRRSGQGAGLQTLSYTVNGSDWVEHDSYEILDAAPQPRFFDFSGIEAVDDNADFAVRITFSQTQEQLDAVPVGGAAGNNRFDDVVVRGFALPGVNLPPLVDTDALPSGVPAFRAGLPASYDLSAIFSDPDGDPLTFSATSSRPGIAAVSVAGDELTLSGLAPGESLITIQADDGTNPAVPASFLVLIYPEAHELAAGPFVFEEWDDTSPAMTFPANMIFLQSETSDPELTTPLTRAYQIPLSDAAVPADADFPYNATSRTRINGLGEDGIAFINTGRGRDVGAALVALDTTGLTAASVSFTTGTLAVNNRTYAIRLQYRVGDDEPFLDVTDAMENPVEYVRSDTTGGVTGFGPINLPAAALDEPYVQLQWKYHYLDGSGSRAQIRLDDILISTTAGAASFAAWQTGNFDAAELADPGVSGPMADPNGAGITNLMRYALGLGRSDTPHHALPTLTDALAGIRFPFDPEKSDIIYRVTASSDLTDWSDIVFDSSQPHTLVPENGHLEVSVDSTGSRRFFRLEVER